MLKLLRLHVSCCVAILSLVAASDASAEDVIDFSSQVRPILSDTCFHCHGPDAKNQDSSFRADTQENLFADLGGYVAVAPGNLEASELHQRIHSEDPDVVMPPPDSNRSLTKKQKQILDLWIKQGAPYEQHWAFTSPTRPKVPHEALEKAADQHGWDRELVTSWLQNPVDAFIAKGLIDAGLQPSSPADPQTLLRRASLTLTGLLPPEKLQVATDRDPAVTYESQVDKLLATDAYAERQTLLWLDAARYADTDGYQNDQHRTNWPWRDWVIKAFRDNMPFDQFTIEQLAGDMLPYATRDQLLASAFNRNHRQNAEAGALAAEFAVENVIDRVETTATVWLGLTMGCCRCHDHKYDPISQQEFYQLYGYFNNIGEHGIGKGVDANPTVKTISPLIDIAPELLTAVEEAERQLDQATKQLDKQIVSWATSLREDKERNLVPPLNEEIKQSILEDKKLLELINKPVRKWNKQEKNTLRKRFKAAAPEYVEAEKNFYDSMRQLKKQGAKRATVMVMRERKGTPTPFYLLDRGQYDQPVKDNPLKRGVPTKLLDEAAEQPQDRLELAKWLVSKANPLTARVIVNRIWQQHFGIGLVKTTEDFGVQGEVPSHPKLLDWLAVEFIESGWDIKAMHRLIVTSAAYRQTSRVNDKLLTADPQNRLLARGPRYRADGFTIRDMTLQASGLLNRQLGGSPVKPYQPAGLWEVVAANAGTRYQVSSGNDLYRKSMYSYWKRAVNPPRQTIFDASGREVCNVRVRRTNTPLQALVLMNDPTFVESARKLAERVLLLADLSDQKRLTQMYRQAIAREITPPALSVLQESLAYFRNHYAEKPEEAQRLLAIGQSPRDETLDIAEHAAFSAVAHVILNLDEFITIE